MIGGGPSFFPLLWALPATNVDSTMVDERAFFFKQRHRDVLPLL